MERDWDYKKQVEPWNAMGMPDLVYIIPPYLLCTTLGSKLQREVESKDSQLAHSNVISESDPHYNAGERIEKFDFSQDDDFAKILKQKLLNKLAVIGVLGTSPMDERLDNGYLMEMFGLLKQRLLEEDALHEGDNGINKEVDIGEDEEMRKKQNFYSSELGETDFLLLNGQGNKKMDPHLSKLGLVELLNYIKSYYYKRSNRPSGLVRFSDGEVFRYPFPVTWAPLFYEENSLSLQQSLDLQIAFTKGCSVISLRTIEKSDQAGEESSDLPSEDKFDKYDKYFNFIADKPLSPAAGVFYYELEVNQRCTCSTNFKPILKTNDTSLSSNSAIHLCMGFMTQYTACNLSGQTIINDEDEVDRINLDKIRFEIQLHREDNALKSNLNPSVESLLLSLPLDFEGSLLFNLEDLSFHSSTRKRDACHRFSLSNIGRRLSSMSRNDPSESGVIDISMPIRNSIQNESNVEKTFSSDIVGCGINFVDRSIFFTVNGVLARVISKEELQQDSIASGNINKKIDDFLNKNVFMFPFLGFQVNDFQMVSNQYGPTELEIKTNLGFKEFKFNIDNYMMGLKQKNQHFLNMSMLDRMVALKDRPNNYNSSNNRESLDNLVKEYFKHEGYLDSYSAFCSDLDDFSRELSLGQDGEEHRLNDVTDESQAKRRLLIKNYILGRKFDTALELLKTQYPDIYHNDKKLIFEIKRQQLISHLKNYLSYKLDLGDNEFTFNSKSKLNEKELFDSTFALSRKLQLEYQNDAKESAELFRYSAGLIVTSLESFQSLEYLGYSFAHYEKDLINLAAKINGRILEYLGFDKYSKLETIFRKLDKGVSDLSLVYNDEKFALLNLDTDHMDASR